VPPPLSLVRRQDTPTLSAVVPVTVTLDGFVGGLLSAPAATGTIVIAINTATESTKQLRRAMQVQAAFHTANLSGIRGAGRMSCRLSAGS
jgi:hypothetical protein